MHNPIQPAPNYGMLARLCTNTSSSRTLRGATSWLLPSCQPHRDQLSDDFSTISECLVRTAYILLMRETREDCLRALLSHASLIGVTKITFELDESVLQFDKRILFRESQKVEPHRRVNYAHENPRSEPLLWIPDAVAWSFVKGGDWRRRISPLLENVIRIQ